MKIIQYTDKYRDDMIFMVLQAKDALGRKPGLNEDLLNIRENYMDKGDMFWLAIDDADRVVGCVGFSRIEGTTEAFIHRLFVKASEKRKGIGTDLLKTAEDAMRSRGITVSRVHLGTPREQWFESYSFYPAKGYHEYEPGYMVKMLVDTQP
ncbi:MAG: GNAT family N-acetyltransferase [Lachnospiraceae bacterium]|nr:GNAT family N-acetyltransferase [Lachnospiraceae bacterium]